MMSAQARILSYAEGDLMMCRSAVRLRTVNAWSFLGSDKSSNARMSKEGASTLGCEKAKGVIASMQRCGLYAEVRLEDGTRLEAMKAAREGVTAKQESRDFVPSSAARDTASFAAFSLPPKFRVNGAP